MGLDSPCPPCPVALGIQGPKTYLDPIRHIYETVDAVETVQPDGSRGHALVFSTVAEGESLSKSIPTGENSLRLLGAINLLASDYMSVYGVNRKPGKSPYIVPDLLMLLRILKIMQTISCHLIFSSRNIFIRMSVPMCPDT